jgi:hypothetical protein
LEWFSFISECGFGGALNRIAEHALKFRIFRWIGFCVHELFVPQPSSHHRARAQHHINVFNAAVQQFADSNPWTHVIEKDFMPGQDLHKLRFTKDLPAILPCILLDAVNNLRSALDQAGYAAALANGKTNPKATNFPFADDFAGLDNNIDRRGVCRDLPAEIVTLFRGCNPHKGGNYSATLWGLNKLCNTKKHCALS